MKNDKKIPILSGGGLFDLHGAEDAPLVRQPSSQGREGGRRAECGTGVELLVSRARNPCTQATLFEELEPEKPGKSEYRFNFCGGRVR